MATLAELIVYVERIIQDSSFTEADIIAYLNQAQLEIAGGMQSALGDWITPPLPNLLTIGTITTDADNYAYTTYAEIKSLISADDTLVFTYNDVEISVTCSGDYSTLQTDIDTELISNSFKANAVVVSWNDTDLILTCNNVASTDTIVGGIYTDTELLNETSPVDTAYIEAAAYVSMPSNFQRDLQFAASYNGAEIDIEDSFILFSETYPLLNQVGSITSVIEKGNNFYYQGIPSTAENVTIHYYKYPTDMSADDDEPDGIPKHLQKSLLVNHACWKIYELIEDGLEGPGVNTQRYMGLFLQALKILELSIPYPNRGMNVLQDN